MRFCLVGEILFCVWIVYLERVNNSHGIKIYFSKEIIRRKIGERGRFRRRWRLELCK